MKRQLIRLFERLADRAINVSQRWSPATKIAQCALFERYAAAVTGAGPGPRLTDAGFRVLSQVDEDGLLLCIFAVIGIETRTFVELGSSDGLECNCANLALNLGWHGLFVDGDERKVERGRQFYGRHPDTRIYPPRFVSARLTRENVNEVIRGAGFEGVVDLLSIDLDGNDYWIWDAIDCIDPRVVIIETHVEFGLEDVVVPYDPEYDYPGQHPVYHGASPVAMARLAERRGYRLVGANRFGFNTIYIREGIGESLIPTIPVEEAQRHVRNRERVKLFEQVRHLPFDRA